MRPADKRVLDALGPSDSAREIIQTVLELAPASHWCFKRFHLRGGSGDIVAPGGGAQREHHRKHLNAELALQRDRVGKGPVIGAALTRMDPYVGGLTLVFADRRYTYAILMLLRSDEDGPFTSTEIRLLTFALEGISEVLSSVGLLESVHSAPGESFLDEPAAISEEQPAMYVVLDPDMNVVFAPASKIQSGPLAGATWPQDRLPAVLERAVRQLTAQWGEDPATHLPTSMQPLPFIIVRVQRLSGPQGHAIGVLFERTHRRVSLSAATTHFALSPRELQVLALILGGKSLTEIGDTLHIAGSTVQDHIRSLLIKTESHNRSEMIRKIMEWDADA